MYTKIFLLMSLFCSQTLLPSHATQLDPVTGESGEVSEFSNINYIGPDVAPLSEQTDDNFYTYPRQQKLEDRFRDARIQLRYAVNTQGSHATRERIVELKWEARLSGVALAKYYRTHGYINAAINVVIITSWFFETAEEIPSFDNLFE